MADCLTSRVCRLRAAKVSFIRRFLPSRLPCGPRLPRAASGSYDDGKTWPWKEEYSEGGSGYTDACVLPDGRVAVLFERDGKGHLGFTVVPVPLVTPPAK